MYILHASCKERNQFGPNQKKKEEVVSGNTKKNNIWQLLLYYEIYMVVAREWHSMAKCEILSNFSGQTSFLSGIDIQKRTGLTIMQSKGEFLKY